MQIAQSLPPSDRDDKVVSEMQLWRLRAKRTDQDSLIHDSFTAQGGGHVSLCELAGIRLVNPVSLGSSPRQSELLGSGEHLPLPAKM